MSRKLALLLLLVLGACNDAPEGAAVTTTTATSIRRDSGCPVEPEQVEAAVGVSVEVEEATASLASCTFLGADDARVVVVVERLPEGRTFADERVDAEAEAGVPLAALPTGLVPGADDGWLVAAGRAVQLAAVQDRRLVVVAVAVADLDADAAEQAAAEVAAAALAG